MDYPYYAEKAASAVKYGLCDLGILICGTGAGMSIAANKVNGVRAANCTDNYTARYAKEHNNANILCLGSRVLAKEAAFMLVDTWLDAEFDGGRHEKRVEMFEQIEQRQKA
jgi:ribose 5-phosphate isomerase B